MTNARRGHQGVGGNSFTVVKERFEVLPLCVSPVTRFSRATTPLLSWNQAA